MDKILVKEWHPTRNGERKLSDFMPGSNHEAWWICRKKHIWKTRVRVRYDGHNCPYCSGMLASSKTKNLFTTNPGLAAEWHPTKNIDLTPRNVSAGSGKKVWWLCEDGHEWQAVINDRNYGRGCPQCNGNKLSKLNNLKSRFPTIAFEWHPTLNGDLTPSTIKIRSTVDVWWICDEGHEWKSSVQSRIINRKRCPRCHN